MQHVVQPRRKFAVPELMLPCDRLVAVQRLLLTLIFQVAAPKFLGQERDAGRHYPPAQGPRFERANKERKERVR